MTQNEIVRSDGFICELELLILLVIVQVLSTFSSVSSGFHRIQTKQLIAWQSMMHQSNNDMSLCCLSGYTFLFGSKKVAQYTWVHMSHWTGQCIAFKGIFSYEIHSTCASVFIFVRFLCIVYKYTPVTIFKLCVCVPGPLAGPLQLRIDEQQSYDNGYYYGSSSKRHRLKSNSSEDRIHLIISWKVRGNSISRVYLRVKVNALVSRHFGLISAESIWVNINKGILLKLFQCSRKIPRQATEQ